MKDKIKIEGEPAWVDLSTLGIYIAEWEPMIAPPQTDMTEQFYPELGHSVIDPITKDKPFEFTAKLGALGNPNTVMAAFVNRTKGKNISIHYVYGRNIISGYISSVSPSQKYHETVAVFEVKIKVNNPSLCNFSVQ